VIYTPILPLDQDIINQFKPVKTGGSSLQKNLNALDELLREVVKNRSDVSTDPLLDHGLSSLGDIYLNFIYSIAISLREGNLTSLRISNKVLAEVMRQSSFRSILPHRLSKHDIGNSAEAILIYAVVTGLTSTGKLLESLTASGNPTKTLTDEFEKIKRRWPEGEK
jgi:hypothetical protein